ncbi:MarR family winged helix-turn-helix transcriptional regulator [Paenisporosarcina cavernae]|uniref:MarR family transcriptional regulator n=1 Tax=Paenisporosarcina cavernae TaxID=2320858 RepID=A0A385YTI2_9BACL|nr:MarR family transcriptional regulator [Paenisporosarcina cavernae]AYC28882.1 MarR family transcriptional regulator [Paenisporosarcina cavernae]
MNRQEVTKEFIHLFRQLIRTSRADLSKLLEEFIPYNEYVFLGIVSEFGPLKPSEVAIRVNTTKAYVTMTSDKLVEKGFLERTRSEEDRRAVFLHVTPKGEEVISQMREIIVDYFDVKFVDLSETEIISVNETLKKIPLK